MGFLMDFVWQAGWFREAVIKLNVTMDETQQTGKLEICRAMPEWTVDS